ncbi:MAG: CRISPR-associated endoribonuclease Cas6 [Thermoflexales bacterium]|nr:CRISPR-associated endoribonuclease Cas6 [Thermoflexales bacterium]
MPETQADVSLYSCVVQLSAVREAALPKTHGDYAEAAFLGIVGATDPALAQSLHDLGTRKPFTVSPLRGLPVAVDGRIRVPSGQDCWLRFTLIGQPIFAAFIQRFLQSGVRPTLRIDPGEFAVTEVLATPGSHPWAGYTTAQTMLAGARTEDTAMLEFASPFSFSLGNKRIDIMPRSELIFGGLQKKWQQWCGLPLPAILERDWLRENVLVAEWHVQSRMLHYGTRLEVGSVGQVMFKIFSADAPTRRTLDTLASFAFYAGVGRKTAQGMGQVRRLDRWAPPPVEDNDDGTD